LSDPSATLFVCISCHGEEAGPEAPGRTLLAAVAGLVGDRPELVLKPVDCLAVCKRPCTVALAGEDKWTYVVGDLDPELHAGDVAAAALSYAASANGIIPWKERPQSFRRGVVSRIPPLGFKPHEQRLRADGTPMEPEPEAAGLCS
jgi:predicted metal-binding protein